MNAEREFTDALDLLGAVGFTLSGHEIVWGDKVKASSLLAFRQQDLPESLSAWLSHIDVTATRARDKALSTMGWDGAVYCVEYAVRRPDGSQLFIEERGRRISEENGQLTIYGVIRDINAERAKRQATEYTLEYDPLTGFYNAKRGKALITQLAQIAERSGQAGRLLACRIDGLEDMRKVYGPAACDEYVAKLAREFDGVVSAPDFAMRAEDDFIFGFFGGADIDLGKQVDALRSAYDGGPIMTSAGPIMAKLVWAYIDVETAEYSAAQFIQALTSALSETVSSDPVKAEISEQPKTRYADKDLSRDEIIEALNSRAVTLFYQPIVHATTHGVHHYECLMRIMGGAEIIPAVRFIPAAERYDLVHLLDQRALEIAGEKLTQNAQLKLALNLSAATLRNDIATNEYLARFKALGSAAQRLTIELTETVAVDDPARAGRFSAAVREMGCTFAIDDFGAGHTTFRNLLAIEADEIKIDGSFIRGIATSPDKQAFVRIMVDLAQTFSVKTVAEFVANKDDADVLARFGVDYLQGYYFGAPMAQVDVSDAADEATNDVFKSIP